MTTITTTLPPQIMHAFSKSLLIDHPDMKKTLESFPFYQKLAQERYGKTSRKMKEFNNIIMAFKEFYGWFEKAKAYKESAHKEKTEKPYFEIDKLNHFRGELRAFFNELFRNGKCSGFLGKNNGLSKV